LLDIGIEAKMSGNSPYFDNAMIFWSVLGMVNTLGSILTLMLIYKLNKVNGYMRMVVAMTLSQTAFDIGLLLFNTSVLEWQYTQLFLGIFCGTATGLWSLVIVFVMVYVIKSRKYFDVDGNFNLIFLVVTVSNLVFSIACLVSYIHYKQTFASLFAAFNMIRVAIIVLTSAFIAIAVYELRNAGIDNQSPVKILARRLCLYPLVQLVSRLPITVYQFHYGKPLREFGFTMNASGTQKFWFIASVVFTPSAGLGNLVAFLNVQPDAYELLRSYFPCLRKVKALHANSRRASKRFGGENTSVCEADFAAGDYGVNPMFEHEQHMDMGMRESSLCDVPDAIISSKAGGIGGLGASFSLPSSIDYEFVEFHEMDEEELVKQIAQHPNRASTRHHRSPHAPRTDTAL